MIKINSEDIVKNYLLSHGFSVSRIDKSENANGVDVVAIKDGQSFLIGVKTIGAFPQLNVCSWL